jgi:hypothetical protein
VHVLSSRRLSPDEAFAKAEQSDTVDMLRQSVDDSGYGLTAAYHRSGDLW